MSKWSDGKVSSVGVNSCVVKLAALDGCSITTTDGLGNSRDGYHPIQKRVVGYNGSQDPAPLLVLPCAVLCSPV